MIALTGDTRGIEALYQISRNEVVQSMSKSDYLIVLGNCGITEANTDFHDNILMYRDLPCSVLFLDGSHDDYDLLADHPVFPWNGGMTQNISRGITHLMRGQVFTICGKKIFTMGGGTTIGRDDTGKYYSWWPEQDIYPTEMQIAHDNLGDVDFSVDLVLTCDCPTSWKEDIHGVRTPCSDSLEALYPSIDYSHWYFSDIRYTDIPHRKATALCYEVVSLT